MRLRSRNFSILGHLLMPRFKEGPLLHIWFSSCPFVIPVVAQSVGFMSEGIWWSWNQIPFWPLSHFFPRISLTCSQRMCRYFIVTEPNGALLVSRCKGELYWYLMRVLSDKKLLNVHRLKLPTVQSEESMKTFVYLSTVQGHFSPSPKCIAVLWSHQVRAGRRQQRKILPMHLPECATNIGRFLHWCLLHE